MTGQPPTSYQTPSASLSARRSRGRRLALIVAVAAYTAAFLWTYTTIVSDLYAYAGLTSEIRSSTVFWFIAIPVAIAPSLWIPTSITRPSMLLYYLHYFLIHIPGAFLLAYNESLTTSLSTKTWAFATTGIGMQVRMVT